ncbi:hypothetical protein CLOLEP_00216 [[Clostridium] leptum DSM 753]|uniref:Uncharacterized protein n=1 Tax=[Clostridium] leptum DSM 753 TaxID=428125 RepID=A7VNT9_9FIRM|nr:hypothetical protein CLOLEP_00216 [[Clostridium] leptum DSM 753]
MDNLGYKVKTFFELRPIPFSHKEPTAPIVCAFIFL